MSNAVLNAVSLDDLAGIAANGSQITVRGIALTRTLTGNLSVNGITQSNGSPQAWVIASGSSGWQATPGSGKAWSNLNFSYASAGDQGAAVAIYQ